MPEKLSSSKNIKIERMLVSHPTYTKFKKAIIDLKDRTEKKVELELSPHMISHMTSENTTIRTHVLKVVTVDKDNAAVLDGLIEALIFTSKEFQATITLDFKFIPFQNHTIGRDELTELTTRQNEFLQTQWQYRLQRKGIAAQNLKKME